MCGTRREVDVERVLFALVANRALKPSSKLAASEWVNPRLADCVDAELRLGSPRSRDPAVPRSVWMSRDTAIVRDQRVDAAGAGSRVAHTVTVGATSDHGSTTNVYVPAVVNRRAGKVSPSKV